MAPSGISEASQDYDENENTPRTGQALMDLLVIALACDLTRVAGMQWADPLSRNRFPWLELYNHHHEYQHDNGYDEQGCTRIGEWYTSQFAYLLQKMKDVREGEGSLLDNALVLSGSEISHPPTHSLGNIPFIVAGSAGGSLRTGRYLRYEDASHADLLIAVQQVFGIEVTTFGQADYASGPLPGLL